MCHFYRNVRGKVMLQDSKKRIKPQLNKYTFINVNEVHICVICSSSVAMKDAVLNFTTIPHLLTKTFLPVKYFCK